MGGARGGFTTSSSGIRPIKQQRVSIRWILAVFVLCSCSFYAGIFIGVHMDKNSSSSLFPMGKNDSSNNNDCWSENDPRLVKFILDQVDAKLKEKQGEEGEAESDSNGVSAMEIYNGDMLRIPDQSMGRVVAGMGRVNRDDFAKAFDTGVPLDQSQSGNKEVLLLYSNSHAIPKQNRNLAQQVTAGHEIPYIKSVDTATSNCDNLHVVLTQPGRERQCIAIMGQYESFHIQKFMRLPTDFKGPVDPDLPLRLVNRGSQQNGRKSTKPPTKEQTLEHWKVLTTYLASFSEVLAQLEPIVKSVAINNTVIVMVCNFGQSELLLNFACNAKAKGLDTSHILVFATDLETKQLAEAFGLAAFYDEINFGRMPKMAAKRYADDNFMAMMGAKVYCVQMVSMLGYDVLFQDVDVVWYKDPLTWFHDESNPDHYFDIYFQDDGNHALYYAPYSANTGFYYVRHNDRTQYFFNSLLMAGDLILSTHSHQIALIALLNEHASMYGLQVKIFERNTEEFPGGFTFHRKKAYMLDLLAGKTKPYIFHMSWTKNKENKKFFFRQMGEWYLQKSCVAQPLSRINRSDGGIEHCCARDPIVTCHYRDKPSKIPCKDSPPIDNGSPSFW